MSTITEEMTVFNIWTQGFGPNYYLPNGHPHLHLQVDNGLTIVNTEEEIRDNIDHLSLTFENANQNIKIWPHPSWENDDKELEWKARLGNVLRINFGGEELITIVSNINALTGLGIDV